MTRNRDAASPHPLPRSKPGMLWALLRAGGSLLLLALLLIALPAGLLYGTLVLAGSNPLPVHESVSALLTSPDQAACSPGHWSRSAGSPGAASRWASWWRSRPSCAAGCRADCPRWAGPSAPPPG
ncbi:hypothetical protein GXW82_20755 [Streptacidiphilus sp. 4-A2]|nr:hypothetical protein [Streptacidiphilus sp. 4-A2]